MNSTNGLECSRCGASDDAESGILVYSVNYKTSQSERFPNVYHEELCTVCRADELRETTVLSPRQAEVRAFSEAGLSRQEIADLLEISINTVDEHRQEIKRKIEQAENTVQLKQ